MEEAAEHEERCEARETGIGDPIYKLLDEEVREAFEWSEERECYVTSDLTVQKLARLRRAKTYERSRSVTVMSSGAGTVIGLGGAAIGRQVVPSRSYCPE